jgi:hypothetical protein
VNGQNASRPGLGAIAWFVAMISLWIAFIIVAVTSGGTLTDIWDWVRALPLAVEILIWIAAFPFMLALAVWQSSWDDWLRGMLIGCFAIAWTAASIPRPRERPTLHFELTPGNPRDISL